MAGTTSPDGISYPTTGDAYSVPTSMAAQATSVQVAFNKRQRFDFVWANAAARTAQTGMVTGSTGYQVDTKTEYIYENSAWRLATPYAEFTATTPLTANTGQTLNGVYTLVSANSTSSVMATPGTSGQITIVDPGLYIISVYSVLSGPATGRTFFDASFAATFTTPFWRNEMPYGAFQDRIGYSFPYSLTGSNTTIYFSSSATTGGNWTAATTVRIARIG